MRSRSGAAEISRANARSTGSPDGPGGHGDQYRLRSRQSGGRPGVGLYAVEDEGLDPLAAQGFGGFGRAHRAARLDRRQARDPPRAIAEAESEQPHVPIASDARERAAVEQQAWTGGRLGGDDLRQARDRPDAPARVRQADVLHHRRRGLGIEPLGEQPRHQAPAASRRPYTPPSSRPRRPARAIPAPRAMRRRRPARSRTESAARDR